MKGTTRAISAAFGLGLLGLSTARPAPVPVALPAPSSAPTPALEGRAAEATVTIPYATVVGNVMNSVESFGGIPFAQAPVGPLRLKPPRKVTKSLGVFDATGPAGACPQMIVSTSGDDLLAEVVGLIANSPFVQKATGQGEDCLTITVARPEGTKAGARLPVLFWIFGGGFELGWSSMYDGTGLVNQGVALGKPFVFVAVNYRVGGFGFLPGKEILADGSANLGLLDQRMGLEWVADHISAFGGDPSKVTIWGESAGAISVLDQMALYGGNITYGGEPLFRAAIMNSGSIAPADPVDCPKGQVVYDLVVTEAGCDGSKDTLQCLRDVDYTTFLRAANSVPGILSYNSVALSYLPRPDGTALPDSPEVLIANKQYAAVPMIIGDQEDEGSLFALFQPNISTTADLVDYLSTLFFHGATKGQLRTLVETYSPLVTEGSPFRTGLFNEIYPGFKRLASILGDLVFTLTRRAFLTLATKVNPDVPSWSYLASYDYGTPILGTFHGSDLLQVFYGLLPNYASRSIQSYYINFLYNLDPNDANGTFPEWPQWSEGQKLVQFFNDRSSYLDDDFRRDSYEWISENVAVLHV